MEKVSALSSSSSSQGERGEVDEAVNKQVSIREGQATIVFKNEAEVFYNPGRFVYFDLPREETHLVKVK